VTNLRPRLRRLPFVASWLLPALFLALLPAAVEALGFTPPVGVALPGTDRAAPARLPAGADRASLAVPATCGTAPFVDVPTTNPFCVDIAWMKSSAISTGFGDGSYRPAAPVTRQAMSAFMARLAGVELAPCASAPFSDVPMTNPFCKEIGWMKSSGISTGFGDGTYKPQTNVTRQAMSAFMARLAHVTLAPCASAPFSDVPMTNPFCKEIKWMKDAGISTGFGDGSYKPATNVTRQAMSAFMRRAAAFVVPDAPPVDAAGAALLVGVPGALTNAEQTWRNDLVADLGDVDLVAYSEASATRLSVYFTIFVINTSPDLNVAGLKAAYDNGATVHLIGPASSYQSQVLAP
jgi:hypothetical protein